MLLAIDSATRHLSLAFHDGARVRAELTWETANQHTVELAGAVEWLAARAGVMLHPGEGPTHLTRIAVCQGPGSFSGLRVGIAFAKGLAAGLILPLTAVPTLTITAAGTPPPAAVGAPDSTPLIAVAQAGRGRVCAARFAWNRPGAADGAGGWTQVTETAIIGWDALLGSLIERAMISGEVEPGVIRDAPNVPYAPYLVPAAWNVRRAAILADLAWALPAEPPAAVAPLYVNQPGLPHP